MTTDHGTCSYCDRPADKFTSGVPECWGCWNWRKLDAPAARYWLDRINHLLERGPDMYDITQFFGKAGIGSEEASQAFETIIKLRDYCDAQIKERIS